jgi:hypothetical protein
MPSLTVDRLPDLSKLERPDIDLGAAMPDVDVDKLAGAPAELGKALGQAASALPIGRRQERGPRRLVAVGLIAAALAGWALATNAALRERLIAGIQAGRQRMSEWLSGATSSAVPGDAPVAFTAAETEPISESPFAPATNRGTPDYPEGLGSSSQDDDVMAAVSGSPERASD